MDMVVGIRMAHVAPPRRGIIPPVPIWCRASGARVNCDLPSPSGLGSRLANGPPALASSHAQRRGSSGDTKIKISSRGRRNHGIMNMESFLLEHIRLHDSLPFFHVNQAVHVDILQFVHMPAGPSDLQYVYLDRLA